MSPFEGVGYRLDRRACGDDVVNDHDRPPGEPRNGMRRHGEGASDIALAGTRGEAHLPWRAPAADDEARIDPKTGEAAEGTGELGRLVVAPRQEPGAMERHRHEDGIARPELSTGDGHQARAEPGELRPVAVFQPTDELAGDLVVDHGGPGAMKGRRVGNGFGRPRVGAEGDLEGQPKDGAIGRRDRTEFPETVTTERIGRRDGRIAVEA